MALRERVTHARKVAADRVLGSARFPFSAREVTRISAWLCLAAGGAYMAERVGWALAAILVALLLDTLDGVVARRNGEDAPEVDWAADRFGEAVLVGPVALRDSWPVAAAYATAYGLNVFLPRWGVPVLPLRHAFAAYCILQLYLR